MIEQTDASKQSDERHVKNGCSTNLLTQKKTGGRHIMGNQGTKNWKLTAFFAIVLMLIAGMFSSTAIAGRGDGSLAVHDNIDAIGGGVDAPDTPDTGFVPVGVKNYQVTFTYTLLGESTTDGRPNAEWVDMADGVARIRIPDGWAMTTPGRLVPRAQYTALQESTDGTIDDGDLVVLDAEFRSSNKEVWVFLPSAFDTIDSTDPFEGDLAIVISFRVDVPSERGGSASADDDDDFVFEASSRTASSSFAGLDSSPEVRVGPRDTIVLASTGPGTIFDDADADDRVYANSESVRVTFTYDPNGGDVNMDESVVEIHIPKGWEYVNDPDETDDDPSAGDATISVSGSVVTVTQGDDPDDTTIAFNVKPPNRRGDFQFTTKSKSKTGALTSLDMAAADPTDSPVQPSVPVGNIMAGLGSVVIRADDDPAAYQGDQDVDFEVTLTAAGPMYSIDKVDTDGDGNVDDVTQQAMIAIAFPFEVADGTLGGTRPAAAIDGIDADHIVVVMIDALDVGEELELSADDIDIPSDVPADEDPMDNIRIYTSTKAGIAEYVRFTDIDNATPDATPAVLSRVDGGYILPKAGSGKVETDPEVVEKGTEKKNITLTYTAATQLIPVALNGTQVIQIELPFAANEIVSASPTQDLELSTLSVIIWKQQATHTAEDQAFEVTVEMNIPDDTDPLEFPARVGSEADVIDTPDDGTYVDANRATAAVDHVQITVVGKGEDVDFEIVDLDSDNLIPAPSYPAASSQIIGFRFTARNTTIEEDGEVSIELPRLWTLPSVRNSSGRATVSVFDAPDGALHEDEPLSTSSREITLEIKKLNKGQSVTIQYGLDPDGDKDYRAVMPDEAGKMTLTGRFKAHPSFGPSDGYTVDTIEAEIGNVADGHGTAIIKPTSVEAGSTDNKITVEFTAPGSMGGGAVSLQIPDGWGEMQHESSTQANYITVTSKVEGVTGNYDDLDDGDGDSIVIAELPDDFDDGDEVIFTYGGDPGTAEANAVAQDSVTAGVAFTIKSDGDGDGGFEPVMGTDKKPTATGNEGLGRAYTDAAGALKVEVVSATAGVGSASIAVTSKGGTQQYRVDGDLTSIHRIHAGDDETQLTFTYNPETGYHRR